MVWMVCSTDVPPIPVIKCFHDETLQFDKGVLVQMASTFMKVDHYYWAKNRLVLIKTSLRSNLPG